MGDFWSIYFCYGSHFTPCLDREKLLWKNGRMKNSTSLWPDYESKAFYDEMFDENGKPRPHYRKLFDHLLKLNGTNMTDLQHAADLSLLNQGVTFTVYSDARGTEKIFPFDLMPRMITADEWTMLEAGIQQRLKAMNMFLYDIYHEQKILIDQIIPTDLVVNSPYFCREMMHVDVPGDVYVHISGIDLIRDGEGVFRVLEDNLRSPSGVSYVVENRWVMARVMPELLQQYRIRAVDHYPQMLFDALASLSPAENPTIAVLTPGTYNSAYFEHAFLANQMGAELVEGSDLLVDNDVLYMKTTEGLVRVDVLYRRVDDDYLDPLTFRADSALGITGIMHAYRAGNLVLANAPGTGVADDKATYAYTPDIIRYYLNEEPMIPIVPTYLCRRPDELTYVLENLENLVVKPTDASGGYGMLVGTQSTPEKIAEFRKLLAANPEHYIAQPVQKLSTHPTLVEEDNSKILQPRHVDLRPYAVCGAEGKTEVLPGGLTRVALAKGQLVVNSSQGGGSKDTWVLYTGEGESNA